eukprot:1194922-Prorocentrum_minimum.AAC.4
MMLPGGGGAAGFRTCAEGDELAIGGHEQRVVGAARDATNREPEKLQPFGRQTLDPDPLHVGAVLVSGAGVVSNAPALDAETLDVGSSTHDTVGMACGRRVAQPGRTFTPHVHLPATCDDPGVVRASAAMDGLHP